MLVMVHYAFIMRHLCLFILVGLPHPSSSLLLLVDLQMYLFTLWFCGGYLCQEAAPFIISYVRLIILKKR
jgi:hypothetical protein